MFMKRNAARQSLVIIACAMFVMSFAPTVLADSGCSLHSVAGDWGYTYTGVVIPSTGAVPVATTGRYNTDENGNFLAKQVRSIGGDVAEETVKGKLNVDSGCRGTLKAKVYQSGQLVRTSVLSVVFSENSSHLRAIFESVTLPDNTNLPAVLTVEGSRQ
jgi:hypothetical protein